jgi:hypothetical protein
MIVNQEPSGGEEMSFNLIKRARSSIVTRIVSEENTLFINNLPTDGDEVYKARVSVCENPVEILETIK